MNNNFLVKNKRYPLLGLRTISESDQENLRTWKNANRNRFFFQGIISNEDQQKWFRSYLGDANDYMFIVISQGTDTGCMGLHHREDRWEIWNVIRGRHEQSCKDAMWKALHLMCSFALQKDNSGIHAKILLDNPAIDWYYRNGFKLFATHSDCLEITLDKEKFSKIAVDIEQLA